MNTGSAMTVVVVGAGIVGASVAYHLSRLGVRVTIVEAGRVASGVTSTSFAWINTCCSGADPVAPLRAAAIADYRRLEAELPGVNVQWTGALTYGISPMPAACAKSAGVATVSCAEILALEPNLKHPPVQGVYAAEEGALNAVDVTWALIEGARGHGARLMEGTQVLGFTESADRVSGVRTSSGVIDADLVVLAAGTGITALMGSLGYSLALEASPAIYIRYRSPSRLVRGIVSNAAMEVRQGKDGSLLAAEDYLDDAVDNRPGAIALRAAAAIKSELHGVASLDVVEACVGLRPVPSDGAPLVGYVPGIGGVYVCVMHPGVTLAATVGRLVGAEIVSGVEATDLAACRLERFG